MHLLRIVDSVLALKSSIGREAGLTELIGFGGRRDDETPLHPPRPSRTKNNSIDTYLPYLLFA